MKQYLLHKLEDSKWECVDTINGLSCVFEQGRLNETQKLAFSAPDQVVASESADKIAKIANDMCIFLRSNYYCLIMPYCDEAIRPLIAIAITAKRKEQGLTQEDLADKTGLHRSHIVRIEQGRYNVTIEVIGKIAHALGCHLGLVPDAPGQGDETDFGE